MYPGASSKTSLECFAVACFNVSLWAYFALFISESLWSYLVLGSLALCFLVASMRSNLKLAALGCLVFAVFDAFGGGALELGQSTILVSALLATVALSGVIVFRGEGGVDVIRAVTSDFGFLGVLHWLGFFIGAYFVFGYPPFLDNFYEHYSSEAMSFQVLGLVLFTFVWWVWGYSFLMVPSMNAEYDHHVLKSKMKSLAMRVESGKTWRNMWLQNVLLFLVILIVAALSK